MNTTELTEQARNAAQTVKETTQDLAGKAKGTVRDAGAAADLYLHEYAWTSIALIAVAAGLLGYVIGSNRRRGFFR